MIASVHDCADDRAGAHHSGDMLKFTSRNDVNADYKCIVRLLDDSEVLECDVQVRSSIHTRNAGRRLWGGLIDSTYSAAARTCTGVDVYIESETRATDRLRPIDYVCIPRERGGSSPVAEQSARLGCRACAALVVDR